MSLHPGCPSCLFCRLVLDPRELGFKVSAQHNIGSTTRHIGCDGDHTRTASLRNNLRFLFVVFSVQHLVLDARLLEVVRELLRGLN